MYAVSALGNRGGEHIINVLKTQSQQVMEQICYENIIDFSRHLIN